MYKAKEKIHIVMHLFFCYNMDTSNLPYKKDKLDTIK